MHKKLIILFVLAFLFRLTLAFGPWHSDMDYFMDWGTRFWQYGPNKFYSANVWSFEWPNEPPGTMYVLAGDRKLYEGTYQMFWWMNITFRYFPHRIMFFFDKTLYPAVEKIPFIASDLGLAGLIYLISNKLKKGTGFFAATLFLLNPITWYNSSVWGQTDSVINLITFASIFLLDKKKLFLAILLFALSVFIKPSLLIFLPIFGIVLIRQKYSWQNIVLSILGTTTIIILLTIPFATKNPFVYIYELYKDKVFTVQLHLITANAFNIWTTIAEIHAKPNSLMLGPLSFELWGDILFGLFVLPILWLVWKKQDFTTVLWSLSLMAFASFMLLTNMHERYLYPLFPPLTILVAQNRKYLPFYIAVSSMHLLNLYNFWWTPPIQPIIAILSWQNRFITRILGLVNFGFFLYIYVQRITFSKKIFASWKHRLLSTFI